jgi:hypothetical protein
MQAEHRKATPMPNGGMASVARTVSTRGIARTLNTRTARIEEARLRS